MKNSKFSETTKLITSDTYQGAGRGVDQGSDSLIPIQPITATRLQRWTDQKHRYRIVLPVENGLRQSRLWFDVESEHRG